MRKSSKQEINPAAIATIQGYHQHGYNQNYAFAGFKQLKYFTSDRFELLTSDYNRPSGRPLKGYGLEIETECNTITDNTVLAEAIEKICFSCMPADLVKQQHDASLAGSTSSEIITQIMTKEFIRNSYPGWKTVWDYYFRAFGIMPGDSCGMHVNISNACFGATENTQEAAIKKLLYIVNKHFKLMAAALNRGINHTIYCGRMGQYTDKNNCKNANLANMPCSHGICFNAGHYTEGRIELRLVGPQKTYGAFRNTMETVFFLVDAVKRLSWDDCDEVVKIFTGCNQYVFNRLSTNVRRAGAIDTDTIDAIAATVKPEELL